MSTQNLRTGDKVIAISNSDAQKYKISDKGKVVKITTIYSHLSNAFLKITIKVFDM